MPRKGPGGRDQNEALAQAAWRVHAPPLVMLALLSLVWTWPLALRFRDHIPGFGGDNYSFVWNLWWMRKALSAPDLDFFRSTYLFSPFGVDLINHPHTALQGYLSATLLAGLTVVEAENLYVIGSVFMNAVCAYALAFDIVRDRRWALVAAVAFGSCPYIAAHLMGHFDLLAAWVIPLFALCLRRSIRTGSVAAAMGGGVCIAIAAYSAYYYVAYLGMLALAYTVASWGAIQCRLEARGRNQVLTTARLVLMALMVVDLFLIGAIAAFGGARVNLAGFDVSATRLQNPLGLLWLLGLTCVLAKWRLAVRPQRTGEEAFWRGAQALAIAVATFAVLCLPLIVQAFRLAVSGRYVSQVYFWQSAPRGVDGLAPVLGHPFHPLYGGAISSLYDGLGLDRIEAVGWLGVVPLIVLLTGRGRWLDGEEARRWKVVLAVFAIWSLGPFLTIAGFNSGLPLPQALARFIPLVENARMPGRAMVCVYLALGVLMALRLAAPTPSTSEARVVGGRAWALIILLALDYLHAPIPLTALDRPVVYEQLASIDDAGAVIEVPFGIGDGLTTGRGRQERRLLYHATIHGHPVVGGYIGRMPPGVAQAYATMPVVGNLLRLSSGEEAIEETAALALPFRYLVLDTEAASPELADYVRTMLDIDLITSGGGKELYAVQGVKSSGVRASR